MHNLIFNPSLGVSRLHSNGPFRTVRHALLLVCARDVGDEITKNLSTFHYECNSTALLLCVCGGNDLSKAPQILHVRGMGITSFGVLIYEPLYLLADKWRHYARHCYIWLIGLKSELHILSTSEVSETQINHKIESTYNHINLE